MDNRNRVQIYDDVDESSDEDEYDDDIEEIHPQATSDIFDTIDSFIGLE